MSLLSLQNMSLEREGRRVLDQISLSVGRGEFVGLIGPNGAGKTTLLRAALGLLPGIEGRSNLAALAPKERAREVAFLPQGREIAWPVAVADLVALGRAPWGQSAGRDDPLVQLALERTGMSAFADRPATALSGGEQARALIARALAQDTALLIADEPGAGLDPKAQIRMTEVFASLAREGRAVIASLHDLGLAARHCSRIIVLDRGRIAADGAPQEALTPALIAEVFGISVWQQQTPEGLVVQPLQVIR